MWSAIRVEATSARVPCRGRSTTGNHLGENGQIAEDRAYRRRDHDPHRRRGRGRARVRLLRADPGRRRPDRCPPAVEAVFPPAATSTCARSPSPPTWPPATPATCHRRRRGARATTSRSSPPSTRVTLMPGPDSDYETFEPGSHCATVVYRRIGQPRSQLRRRTAGASGSTEPGETVATERSRRTASSATSSPARRRPHVVASTTTTRWPSSTSGRSSPATSSSCPGTTTRRWPTCPPTLVGAPVRHRPAPGRGGRGGHGRRRARSWP